MRGCCLKIIVCITIFVVCVVGFAHAASLNELLPDEKNNISIFQNAAPNVVYIHRLVQDKKHNAKRLITTGAGSGMIWDKEGHIVTNFHVIQGANAIRLTFDKITLPAQLIGFEPHQDIAVLQIKDEAALAKIKRLSPFTLVNNSGLMVGQKAIAIGNPYGFDHSLTVGVISALKREVPGVGGVAIRDMIQTDAAINPGNSGGPLLDSQGRLLGMNTAIYSNSGSAVGINFAVSADTIQTVVPQLIAKGHKMFLKWLGQLTSSPWVCMEATGHYSETIADFLAKNNIRVSVVNPFQVKSFARASLARNKNDSIDAKIIAQFAQRMEPRLYQPTPAEQKEIKDLTKVLDMLKAQLIQLNNQLHSIQGKAAQNTLEKMAKKLEKEIFKIEKEIADLVANDKQLNEKFELLTSIKGIGKLTAFRVIALMPNIGYLKRQQIGKKKPNYANLLLLRQPVMMICNFCPFFVTKTLLFYYKE